MSQEKHPVMMRKYFNLNKADNMEGFVFRVEERPGHLIYYRNNSCLCSNIFWAELEIASVL